MPAYSFGGEQEVDTVICRASKIFALLLLGEGLAGK